MSDGAPASGTPDGGAGRWRSAYSALLAVLAAEIALLAWLTGRGR